MYSNNVRLSLLYGVVPFYVLFGQVISLCEKPRDPPVKVHYCRHSWAD